MSEYLKWPWRATGVVQVRPPLAVPAFHSRVPEYRPLCHSSGFLLEKQWEMTLVLRPLPFTDTRTEFSVPGFGLSCHGVSKSESANGRAFYLSLSLCVSNIYDKQPLTETITQLFNMHTCQAQNTTYTVSVNPSYMNCYTDLYSATK